MDSIITKALRIRAIEYKLLELFNEGKIPGTLHTCIGQELIPVIVSSFHKGWVFSNHRGHGHYLAHTGDEKGLFHQIMTGYGSQHLCNEKFLSGGIQGGLSPVACGVAYSLNERVVCYIGDGTLGEGVLYEAWEFCGKFKLPVTFILENNGIAQTTKTNTSGIYHKATGFGLKYFSSSTVLPLKLMRTTEEVFREVGPVLFDIRTQRLMSHSKGDDTRDPKEIASLWNLDPLKDYPLPEIEVPEFTPYVNDFIPDSIIPYSIKRTERFYTKQIKKALEGETVIGEDLDCGAFGCTDSGINTPISEACIVGFAVGIALTGKRAIAEIMFGDFLGLAFDQILNNPCKLPYFIKRNLPCVIRTPMGARRGYGPTHSQSIEKYFMMPGLTIIAQNHRVEPFYKFDSLTLVIENKMVYVSKVEKLPLNFNVFFLEDTVVICPLYEKPRLTIFCYGGMLIEAEKALIELNEKTIPIEIICPVIIHPLRYGGFYNHIEKLLIVEEGSRVGGVGSELVTKLHKIGIPFELMYLSNEEIIGVRENLPDAKKIVDIVEQWIS